MFVLSENKFVCMCITAVFFLPEIALGTRKSHNNNFRLNANMSIKEKQHVILPTQNYRILKDKKKIEE